MNKRKQKSINYEIPENTDDNVIHNWEPLKRTIDSSFKYEHNIVYRFFSRILWWVAVIVLVPVNYIMFGTKVKGRKNCRKVKTGAVIVANHNHIMDMTMLLTRVNFPSKSYILANKSSFQIPVVRRLVGPLGAIPIADTLDGQRKCFAYVNKLLQNNKKIVVYPEGSMWPYYTQLRPFKDGAFKFASDNNVPIIPLSITFRKPTGLFKLYKRKPLVSINVMEPIYPLKELTSLDNRKYLKEKTFNIIEEELKKSFTLAEDKIANLEN